MQIASRQIAISLHKTKLVLLNFTCLNVKYLLETSQCFILCSFSEQYSSNWNELTSGSNCLSLYLSLLPLVMVRWDGLPFPHLPPSHLKLIWMKWVQENFMCSLPFQSHILWKNITLFYLILILVIFSILSYICQKYITVLKASNFFLYYPLKQSF